MGCTSSIEHTSNLVVDRDGVDNLAADGATVGFVVPFPQAGVVQQMAARFDFRYIGSGGIVGCCSDFLLC